MGYRMRARTEVLRRENPSKACRAFHPGFACHGKCVPKASEPFPPTGEGILSRTHCSFEPPANLDVIDPFKTGNAQRPQPLSIDSREAWSARAGNCAWLGAGYDRREVGNRADRFRAEPGARLEGKMRELSESNERYRRLLESVTNYVYTVKVENGKPVSTEHCARCLDVTGFTPSEYDADPELWLRMVHEADCDKVIAAAERVLTAKAPVSFTHRIRHKNGSVRWVESTLVPRFNDKGELCSYDGIITDITAKKNDEDELACLAAAVEQSVDDFIITDKRGVIRYVNPAFTETHGYAREEAVGRHVSFLNTRGAAADCIERMMEDLRAGKCWFGRYYNHAKSGGEILLEARVIPYRDSSGKLVGYISAQRDITLQSEMEAHIAQSQRLEAIGTLAGGIAHDFNNILTAIMGFNELAMAKATDSESKECLAAVSEASQRAADLVKQILTFARHIDDSVEPVHTCTVVKEALKLLKATTPSTIEIRLHTLATPTVLANPAGIYRILVNLCTNASFAMREKGGVMTVTLSETAVSAGTPARIPGLAPGRYMRLTVEDTGCGIPDEIKSRIFEPFFSTREKGEGTGMGLSVVHGIVVSLGGVVTVSSSPGVGSAFDVYLPCSVESAGKKGSDSAELPCGCERVLFVDDEPAVSVLVRKSLGRLGYSITALTSSIEAAKIFMANPGGFDLVITDQTMPGLTGSGLLERIKEVRGDIPVIVCSGYGERWMEEFGDGATPDALLAKPFEIRRLATLIREILEHRHAPS